MAWIAPRAAQQSFSLVTTTRMATRSLMSSNSLPRTTIFS